MAAARSEWLDHYGFDVFDVNDAEVSARTTGEIAVNSWAPGTGTRGVDRPVPAWLARFDHPSGRTKLSGHRRGGRGRRDVAGHWSDAGKAWLAERGRERDRTG